MLVYRHTRCSRPTSSTVNDSSNLMASWKLEIAVSSFPRFLSTSATLARDMATSMTWMNEENSTEPLTLKPRVCL